MKKGSISKIIEYVIIIIGNIFAIMMLIGMCFVAYACAYALFMWLNTF